MRRVKAIIPKPRLDRIVMALNWNKQAKPTTKPVNTSAVVMTSRQYNRSNTERERNEGENFNVRELESRN